MFDSVVESDVTRGGGGGDWAIPGGLGLCGTAGGVVVFAVLVLGGEGFRGFFTNGQQSFKKALTESNTAPRWLSPTRR